ncbi:MAG: hypothetical protein PPHERAN_3735 [uncultured Paraburkholderia sp.]|nr:MAG: hypothetical protein PPHERAN_3735 [uncultured Paraburkholderia sp.]
MLCSSDYRSSARYRQLAVRGVHVASRASAVLGTRTATRVAAPVASYSNTVRARARTARSRCRY